MSTDPVQQVDLSTLSDDEFRLQAREWFAGAMADLRERWPEDVALSEEEDIARRRRYAELLGRDGWAALSWPVEFNGRGGSVRQQLIFLEESVAAEVPVPLNRLGIEVLGPALMRFADEAQRDRFLPRMLNFEDLWCQGFSEPEAGSDLAGLRTRADRTDGGWRINGQKTWTSVAHSANLCLVLARTDREVAKHKGISVFVVDMTAPGVSVQPIAQINGAHEFCDVFFDDVEVPEDALIGEPGQGWAFAMTALGFERSVNFLAGQLKLIREIDELIAQMRAHAADVPSRLKDRLVTIHLKAEQLRAAMAYHVEFLSNGGEPGPPNSATKIFWSELWQEVADLGAELEAEVPGSREGATIDWTEFYVYARVGTIYAGTNEIQRNIIAERALGMPR
jgi:alkylation response protein AidB-like acyl-CoA dehydrogenase